ncbi:MAG TPA: triphosphoribosyl-dephospho-CoA synthase CitG [Methylomusa anaerophila]|uniref:Probable 2-(5''-triphosphoribosyl)-3'-dephosphocoenzyme-A synthase n=1 Tax=Methylomusa anaerophila TaxID=1930071 RepID=A0A348AHT4_9FIRM|nr:triphosphoribosyl-dephospho-CoA synthase CitG [Methylomusa anaerophila]BBB90632.1 2-(5''-triphosphoribosyl)-3'-dephosphocoenzyme-A synthase [Methylomusa anaerophila]HML88761.1 triphosphoribosyl-dephospho-CoA synthase CitG [Methylomusa anaerophila]
MVTLEAILAAKEARQSRQAVFRKQHPQTMVSITINMPGPVKDTPVIRQLADYAGQELKKKLNIIADERIYLFTGPEILLAVAEDAHHVKRICMSLEEQQSFGRLLDLDVFSAGGGRLSRQDNGQARGCLVCGDPAVVCRREGRHQLAGVLAAANKLLDLFSAYQTRWISESAGEIGTAAVEAMLFEVAATPAPGLVDRVNAGAHTDMDFFTFMSGTAALSTTMARCAQAGYNHTGELPQLLPVLRCIGREGEAAMRAATQGINTQKGLVFSLGITAAAAGWLIRRQGRANSGEVLNTVAAITAGIVARELAGKHDGEKTEPTAGERLYLTHGITGIRGEMEQGLPVVRQWGLPTLKKAVAAGLTINDALIDALLAIMTVVEDTTVMHRCGPEKMHVWVRQKAKEALAAGGMGSAAGRDIIHSLDAEFIARNVSPGGAADLLAVTWFLYRLDTMVFG